mmetsp:Transcript_107674/g.273424  ORF Transcript_107674/g.273424 Transcript_107674/m.273424 type:complete len:212 (+) Transcript_107674:995-1630(+)
MFAFASLRDDLPQAFFKIPTHSATHAPIIHHDDLLCKGELIHFQQVVVDRNFAKLILDDGNLLPTLLLEDVVEQRCLASAQKPSQDGYGQLAALRCNAFLCLPHLSYHTDCVAILKFARDRILRADWLVRLRIPSDIDNQVKLSEAIVKTVCADDPLHCLGQLHDCLIACNFDGPCFWVPCEVARKLCVGVKRQKDLQGIRCNADLCHRRL